MLPLLLLLLLLRYQLPSLHPLAGALLPLPQHRNQRQNQRQNQLQPRHQCKGVAVVLLLLLLLRPQQHLLLLLLLALCLRVWLLHRESLEAEPRLRSVKPCQAVNFQGTT